MHFALILEALSSALHWQELASFFNVLDCVLKKNQYQTIEPVNCADGPRSCHILGFISLIHKAGEKISGVLYRFVIVARKTNCEGFRASDLAGRLHLP